MFGYKKSGDMSLMDSRLPSKYRFRRTLLLQGAAAPGPEPPTTPPTYPQITELYTCAAEIAWHDTATNVWLYPGRGTLSLLKTVDLDKNGNPLHTACIVVTNQDNGRVLCREPIRKGLDFSSKQNKLPPTSRELRCLSFELATGAPMLITCDSLEISTKLWEKIRELQRDEYLY